MITLDTEQMWGYSDEMSEAGFQRSFPNARETAEGLLSMLCDTGISATWSVVGGLSLASSSGPADGRFQGLPASWVGAIRPGSERTAPLWYARSFVKRVRDAAVVQELGLHGGLTHMLWRKPRRRVDVLRAEISGGIKALAELGIRPTSFTFPRNIEASHSLLREHGIRCYRGRGPSLGEQLAGTVYRPYIRAFAELGSSTPPPVWPEERLPGLWNIPSSLLLYRMNESRAKLIPFSRRVARVRRGIEAAAKAKGIFHLWLHPDNLAESPRALPVFEEILREVVRARERGDITVRTMTQIADRMESAADGFSVWPRECWEPCHTTVAARTAVAAGESGRLLPVGD